MTNHIEHFDDQQLEILVFGDEDTLAFQDVADHVEFCDECQSRLLQLTGSRGEHEQIAELLSGYAETEFTRSLEQTNRADESPQLDFLADPSHPEMLGRLGRYEIERVIGAGGMGIVLRGFDTELNRPVAIKTLARHLAHSGSARQRFAREARAAAAIVHENVVAIHNVETDHEVPFLVMQLVAGESLQARVDQRGPLDPKEVLRIGRQAAAGLQAAHEQGVIHRDVKPANILLESGVDRALLTDFGLARTVDDASLTHTGIVAGTPHYMSPEQADGQTVDQRTDLFSLGSVLYFMATGRPPFRAERPMGVLKRICHDQHRPVWEVNVEIPDSLSDAIDRLLEKKPSRRFADANQTRIALSTALSDLQQPGKSRGRRNLRRMLARHRTVAGCATACLLMLVALLIYQIGFRSAVTDVTTQQETISESNALSDQELATLNSDREFGEAVNELNTELDELERTRDAIGFGQTTADPWHSDAQELDAELSQLEQTFSSNADQRQE